MKMLIIGNEDGNTLDKGIVFVEDGEYSPPTKQLALGLVEDGSDIQDATVLAEVSVPDTVAEHVYTMQAYIG